MKIQRESKEFRRISSLCYDAVVLILNLEAAIDDWDKRFGEVKYISGKLKEKK